jgi:hypothetical protein
MSQNSVILKNYLKIREEYNAAAAITPGMLVELTSAGKVQAHSNAGFDAIPMFAFEDELQGKDIDEDYAADDPVQVWIPQRGDQAYAILADGENASTGDFLESDGNGYLQVYSKEDSAAAENAMAIVAQALEDVDLSGSSGEESSGALGYNKRIKVRIV